MSRTKKPFCQMRPTVSPEERVALALERIAAALERPSASVLVGDTDRLWDRVPPERRKP